MQTRELGFGEVFINTGNLLKPFDVLTALRGCKINFFGGGNNKVFVVYEDQIGVQKIIPLHPAEIDQYDYTVSDGQETENFTYNTTENQDDKTDTGKIMQLKSDQNFNLFLNDRNEVFVTGQGTYGTLGLGNRRLAMNPTSVFQSKFGIKSISCGSGHCMILTNDKSLYVWGRNFEGQLGIPYIQISCKPLFNPFFNYIEPKIDSESQKKIYIEDIYLAGCHSFIVLNDRSLYACGENLYGQLGLPRKSKYTHLMKVPIDFEVKTIAASKTHTFILTQSEDLYSVGLNNYGQLGLGQMLKQHTFSHIFEDFHNNPLPKFQSIHTNYNSSLAVTVDGELYAWGKSVLLEEKQVQPVKIEMQKDIASIDKVFLSNSNCLLFSKLAAYEVTPRVSPSSGNTRCSMRGYGFTDFNSRQKLRFRLSFKDTNLNRTLDEDQKLRLVEIKESCFETSMEYNHNKNTFEFITPLFYIEHYLGDAEASIDISLDGHSWVKTSLIMVIYNCNTRILELNPIYIHVNDAQKLKIQLSNTVHLTNDYNKDVQIAFLKKQRLKKRMSRFGDEPETLPNANRLPRLLTVTGLLEDSHIICDVPRLDDLNDHIDCESNYTCYVSVTLDGQQLFEASSEITYYSISEVKITPLCVKFEGGINHTIEFENPFDSPLTNLQLVYDDKTLKVKPSYFKLDKIFEFHSPPIEPVLSLKHSESQENQNQDSKVLEFLEVDLQMTMCGNYYQSICKLIYHTPKIEKVMFTLEKEKNESDQDYRSRMFKVEDPFYIDPELSEKEAEKKRKEFEKKINMLETGLRIGVAKSNDMIFLKGRNFVVGQPANVKLTWSEDLMIVDGVVKSSELIVFEIPVLRAEQTVVSEISADVSFNTKQYTNNCIVIDALFLRKDITDELKDKETQEFLKKYKKPKKQ